MTRAEDEPRPAAERLAAIGFAPPPASSGWVPAARPAAAARTVPVEATTVGAPEPARAAQDAAGWFAARFGGMHAGIGPGALLALVCVCLACVAVTAATLLRHPAEPAVRAPTSPPIRVPLTTPAARIVVDVGGRVRRPGLVTLPLGARVADALRAAGGAIRRTDLLTLNLAARVSDGQLLLVGVPATVGAPGAAAADGPVSLNTATVQQLDALPGVGPVLAQHIVDWREAHGGFTSVSQLQQVSGIGARKYDELKSLVTV
jgi:competence protein ComEA